MILSFDKFERYEVPQVTLCNPNSRATEVDGKITITDTVGVLSNPKGMSLKLNFNAPHELSFDYYRHKSTDPIKQSFYDSIYEAIQTDRYIYLTDIGYFIISSVTDSDEDNIDKKSISLKSCEENELATAEGLHLKEGTYYLHTANNDGLLDLFLPKTAGWTMGYIDPSLLTKPYFVEDTEVDNGYNFLYTTIQDMYECIVEPDIIKRTISVYSRAYYAEHHLTDIHIAKYNLLKHKTVEENDEDKYTALNVQGKDENLEIRTVNPTGKNVIYNFEPRYAWMSPALQQAIEKWQAKCESVEDEYLTLQQGYYTEQELLFNKQKDIEVLELGLKQLQSTRDFITSGAADNYLENIKLYCTQYNSNVNGNVDYAKRPFISPEEMVLAGYPEFSNPDEEVATTYDCDYAFMNGSGSVLYTIKMTPIIEDRTVLSVEGLDAYYDAMASSCSTKEQLLAYDAAHSKLIINIANGDTPRDSEGLTTLDKTLMPIKNNHWATVKAFMKAAGLDMTNLSNVLNEIENRQTALSHVNSAIATKQSEINKATSDYNAHKSVVHTNYEEPISQINKDCALDVTAKDIDGNTIFIADLLNELMTHIKPTEYVDEYMLVTESMTYPQRFEKAKELMDRAKSQLVKISSGQKTYSIDTRSFLFNKQFKHFSEQLCAGAIIYVETKNDTMEQLHLTGIDINFDEKSTNFTLGNKYDRSDLKALYDEALGQNSKSFSELKYIAGIIEEQQKQLDYQRNWVADLRTLTLDNVLTSEDQAFEINNRGLIGRKRQLNEDGSWKFDKNNNPLFELEQVKLINNTLVFTKDNWNHAETAVGKIAVGYDSKGNVEYSYGINGRVLIGELILGNNLVLTGTGAGIKITDSNGNSAFYADENGNLVLSGTIFANSGTIGGWSINSNTIYSDTEKWHTQFHVPSVYGDQNVNGSQILQIYDKLNKYWPFSLTSDGTLMTMKGNIGGWILQNGKLYTSYDLNGTKYCGIGRIGYSCAFYAGATSDDGDDGIFRVGHDGFLTTTSGRIGGWLIDSHKIYTPSSWNSSEIAIWGTGLAKSSAVNDPAFYAGFVGNGGDPWSHTKLETAGVHDDGPWYNHTNFYVTNGGHLVAKDATIKGTLQAGSVLGDGAWQMANHWLYAKKLTGIDTDFTFDYDVCLGAGGILTGTGVDMKIKTWTDITGSDRAFKENINQFSEEYDIFFNNLKPCKFNYNNVFPNGNTKLVHFGFIAQDIMSAKNDAQLEDLALIGIHSKEYYGLYMEEFIALNTWQIQRCKKRIASLENTVEELKTQIQTLTAG